MDRGPWIQTLTGRTWYPVAPQAEDVCDEDVAGAIAKVCRFGGHSTDFYSVAQHSVLVARLLKQSGASAAIQLQGLVHDAHEAYPPGDVLAPVKRIDFMHGGKMLERRAALAVRAYFGVPGDLDRAVVHADLAMLAAERRDVMAPSMVVWGDLPVPPAERIGTWTWQASRAIWLDLLTELRQEVRRG